MLSNDRIWNREGVQVSRFKDLLGKQVDVEVSGKNTFTGKFLHYGLDIVVIYHEQRYFYIPLVHIQQLKLSTLYLDEPVPFLDEPIDFQEETISYRKILSEARGRFLEIYVTGNKSIHGYLTSIMNDYFVFYSPVYKSMFVSLHHVKWFLPYHRNVTPYSLSDQSLPFQPAPVTLSRTFKEQCKKFEGKLVVFDLGDHPNKIGLLQKVDDSVLELINANGETIYWNLQHLKTVYAV
jgi:hypothetical protein